MLTTPEIIEKIKSDSRSLFFSWAFLQLFMVAAWVTSGLVLKYSESNKATAIYIAIAFVINLLIGIYSCVQSVKLIFLWRHLRDGVNDSNQFKKITNLFMLLICIVLLNITVFVGVNLCFKLFYFYKQKTFFKAFPKNLQQLKD